MTGSDLHQKLSRFQSHIAARPAPVATGLPDHYLDMAKVLDGIIRSNHAGAFCLVKTHYNSKHSYGDMSFGGLLPGSSLPLSAFTRKEESGFVPVSSLLFFDTETTGLGGTGTVAFLVGCGSVTQTGFEVRQYLMPDYSDEAAMLEELSSEFGLGKVPVSYNGAAFDLPILRDRMIINRVAREIPFDRHIDLLAPARRLFRRRLGDCRLINIEKELFGFYRDDDVPGYLIPSIYFEWLSECKTDNLAAVLKHNRLDIVSLYYLTGLIACAFQSQGSSLTAFDDLHSLSRIYGFRKDNEKVVGLYRRMESCTTTNVADDVLLFHAQAFKRTGAFEKAVALWEQLSGSRSREGFWANVELAKYYEHRAKDIEKAHRYTVLASTIDTRSVRERDLLQKRLARLSAKLAG